MPKFHIAVIAEVSCDSFAEAKELVYKFVEEHTISGMCGTELVSTMADALPKKTPICLIMANDSARDKLHRRVWFAHPIDTHAEYDMEEYEKNIEEDDGNN
jgi:hypothetical protein